MGPFLLVVKDLMIPLVAAFAVCVPSGASSNPNAYPGMGHLTEHCVFLGRANSPAGNKNKYQSHLLVHGKGATLAPHRAHWSCSGKVLFCPVLAEEACWCELSAIEAEDARNQGTNTCRRRMQAFKDAFVLEH